jgi:hypothetical protein
MQHQSVTIVLEWDNAEGLARDQAMYFLRRLACTIRDSRAEIPRPATLLLVFDGGVDQAALRAMLDECAADMRGCLQPKLLYAPEAEYYEKKGVAAFFDTGDILVYADSDCRYSENWLEDILEPLLSGRADMACGDTVALEDGTLMGTMSALGWFFPLRSAHDPLLKKGARRFFANNFAIRRKVLEEVPIPRLAAARAHGGPWFRALVAAGVRTEKVTAAVAEHKQFDRFGDFLARAWMLGIDKDVGVSAAGGSRPYRIWRAVVACGETPVKYLRRFFSVGLTRVTPLDALPVFLGGLAFSGVTCLSHLIASLTRGPAAISTDYSSIIATSRILPDQPAARHPQAA